MKTFAYGNPVSGWDLVEMIMWAEFGHSLSFTSLLLQNFVRELTQSIRIYLHIIRGGYSSFSLTDNHVSGCMTLIKQSEYLILWDSDWFLHRSDKLFSAWLFEGDTLKKVKTILSKAADAYHSLCTEGKWHVSSKSTGNFSVAWHNYAKEGCSVNKHPQPKVQKNIATNRKIFSKNAGGNVHGNKSSSSHDSSTYTQNKWGASKSGLGIKLFRKKLMCWCGMKDCDWNTIHTTSFYNAYQQNPINLCDVSLYIRWSTTWYGSCIPHFWNFSTFKHYHFS